MQAMLPSTLTSAPNAPPLPSSLGAGEVAGGGHGAGQRGCEEVRHQKQLQGSIACTLDGSSLRASSTAVPQPPASERHSSSPAGGGAALALQEQPAEPAPSTPSSSGSASSLDAAAMVKAVLATGTLKGAFDGLQAFLYPGAAGAGMHGRAAATRQGNRAPGSAHSGNSAAHMDAAVQPGPHAASGAEAPPLATGLTLTGALRCTCGRWSMRGVAATVARNLLSYLTPTHTCMQLRCAAGHGQGHGRARASPTLDADAPPAPAVPRPSRSPVAEAQHMPLQPLAGASTTPANLACTSSMQLQAHPEIKAPSECGGWQVYMGGVGLG